MGLAGAWAEASEALQTQINAAVMVNTLVIVRPLNAVPTGRTNTTGQPHVCAQQPRVCTPEGTPPRLVAELRLTQDRRDVPIRVAERAWMYTMKSLDRFPRGFIPQGEHQCARNDLFEESS
jgi:hypothetical protein